MKCYYKKAISVPNCIDCPRFAVYAISVFACIFLIVITPSISHGFTNNYYAGANPQQLKNLQKNHINPAIIHMQNTQYLFDEKGNKKDGNFKVVLGDIDFVLRYIPNHPTALDLLDRLCLMWEKPDIALSYHDRAIKAFPREFASYVLLGRFLLLIEKPQAALVNFDHALKLNPNNGLIHHYLAVTYQKLNQPSKAQEHASRASQLGHNK